MRRAADVVFALLGLALCAPLFLVLALVLWSVSPGPLFGLKGGLNSEGRWRLRLAFDTKAAPEPVSRFFQETQLDQLPVLLSVLKGDWTLWQEHVLRVSPPARSKPRRRFRVPRSPLSVFRYFVSRETRELVDDCLGDIRRDAREMNRKKVARGWIHAMVWWKSWSCMASIVWEGVKRTLARVLPGAALWRRLTAGDR